MSIKHARNRSARIFTHAALPLALAAILLSRNIEAQPTEVWQATTTQAALLKVTSPTDVPSAPSNSAPKPLSQSSPTPHWALNVSDTPELRDDIAVTPLEASKQLRIAVTLPMRNRDQFYAFLKNLHDPKSASYRKYLTPQTYKAAYGPTEQDTQKVVAYLQKNGFSGVSVSGANQLITANGNAMNVSAAFNTSVKQFTVDCKQFYGNDSTVQVPQSLAGIVGAVLGLQNISVKHTYNHRVELADNAGGTHVGHSPIALQKIYHTGNSPTAYATNVAVIGWNDQTQTQTDLDQFTAANLLEPVKIDVIKVPADGKFLPDYDGEWQLDTQTIVGVSGGVNKLMFYTASSAENGIVLAAETRAVDDNIAKLINCSFGVNEVDPASKHSQKPEDDLLARAEAQGQIFSVSSGDSGAYTWARGIGMKLSKTYQDDRSRYSVSWPAASSHVVAVGGTTLFTAPADSMVWAREVTWNDGFAGDGTFWAGGGGISHYIDAPDWQKNTIGAAADIHRVVPDVAFNASYSVVIVNGQPARIGGTSLASPIFVGALARIETAANNSIGLPNSDMYRDFSNGGNAALLHDITSGNNGIVDGPDVFGFSAGPGFDLATGWGSFDIDLLRVFAVAHWGDGSAPPAPPIKPAAVITALQNNIAVQKSGVQDSDSQFTIEVPAGAKALNLRTSGGSGDVALYVKFGGPASALSYDFISNHLGTNNESITIGAPNAGTYYVTVRSPVTYANVNVAVRYIKP